MAKKAIRTNTAGWKPATDQAELWMSFPNDVKGKIEGIRPAFNAYAGQFQLVNEKRADLAPKLMAVYHMASAATKVGSLQFVSFLRLIDPSIPSHRDAREVNGKTVPGYTVHNAYNAGIYCKRLTQTGPRQKAVGERAMTGTQMLARVIATMLPLVADSRLVFDAVKAELRLDDKAIKRLETAVTQTQPLFTLPTPKQPLRKLNIIHMAPKTGTAEGEQPARRTGTHG